MPQCDAYRQRPATSGAHRFYTADTEAAVARPQRAAHVTRGVTVDYDNVLKGQRMTWLSSLVRKDRNMAMNTERIEVVQVCPCLLVAQWCAGG